MHVYSLGSNGLFTKYPQQEVSFLIRIERARNDAVLATRQLVSAARLTTVDEGRRGTSGGVVAEEVHIQRARVILWHLHHTSVTCHLSMYHIIASLVSE